VEKEEQGMKGKGESGDVEESRFLQVVDCRVCSTTTRNRVKIGAAIISLISNNGATLQ